VIIGIASLGMLLLGEGLAMPLSALFAGYDPALYDLTLRGFYIYSFSFLFSGIAIYGSSFFTALNNGILSAVMSFTRTLVFQVAAVLLLPLAFDIDGIWYSIIVAELMAAAVTVGFLVAMRKKYQY
jgi:Na+-driven multidrug efflux pump